MKMSNKHGMGLVGNVLVVPSRDIQEELDSFKAKLVGATGDELAKSDLEGGIWQYFDFSKGYMCTGNRVDIAEYCLLFQVSSHESLELMRDVGRKMFVIPTRLYSFDESIKNEDLIKELVNKIKEDRYTYYGNPGVFS
jgi:hypothetical protein